MILLDLVRSDTVYDGGPPGLKSSKGPHRQNCQGSQHILSIGPLSGVPPLPLHVLLHALVQEGSFPHINQSNPMPTSCHHAKFRSRSVQNDS